MGRAGGQTCGSPTPSNASGLNGPGGVGGRNGLSGVGTSTCTVARAGEEVLLRGSELAEHLNGRRGVLGAGAPGDGGEP